MSVLTSIAKKVEDGIFELKPEASPLSSFFNPTVVLCERDRIGGSLSPSVKSIYEEKYRRGFYICLDTNLMGGRYNVFVGSGGMMKTKDSQTLFTAIADQASRNPDDSEEKNPFKKRNKWDKAILVCDWEQDIQFRKIYAGSMMHDHDKYNKPVNNTMKDDIKLAGSFCNIKLKEYEDSGSLRVSQNKQNTSNLFISNFYDSDRYEYYVHLALKFVECLIPDFAEKPKPQISTKDKLYGEFDAEAIVLDNCDIRVIKFKVGGIWAKKQDRKGFNRIDRDGAAIGILKANGRNSKPGGDFWHVAKNDKLQPIKNFEFEEKYI